MDDPAVIFTAPAFEQVVTAVPAVAVAGALILMVLVVLTAAQPPGASEVNVSVMMPLKVPTGVYVTVAGDAVGAVLLKVPPPDEVIDQAAVLAPPP